MVQGTSSHVGKSVLVAAFCRILRDEGLRVAPFKAQNMALNSHVTSTGGEVGVAQALQAAAAGVDPTVDMNPVLLKPTGDRTSQVIIGGRVHGVMSATEYHAFKKEARRYVVQSYEALAGEYDAIVIEGAGSPAEINLREGDLANMGVAEIADSPVILAGDIDRGGVFASLVGTLELLAPEERARIKGFLINKFRGDRALLEPGLDFLTEKTGVPVLGVVPFMDSVDLPDEDGVALDGHRAFAGGGGDCVRVVVVRLPRISNFTDFDPLKREPGVEVVFASRPGEIRGADLVVIPGSKNTLSDLAWMRDRGFEGPLSAHREAGGMVAGICGGFQMLGRRIEDPHGVESTGGGADGLGVLDAATVMGSEKATHRVRAVARPPFGGEYQVEGYEIHMGETTGKLTPFAVINTRGGVPVEVPDGGVSPDGLVWGSYLHGLFDNDLLRRALLAHLAAEKGVTLPGGGGDFAGARELAIASLASTVASNVRMDEFLAILGVCGR